jgi:hypothetical protein
MNKSELRTGDLILTTIKNDVAPFGKFVKVYIDHHNRYDDLVSGCTWFPLKSRNDEHLFEWDKVNHFGDQFVEVWRPKANIGFKENIPSVHTHDLIWKKEIKPVNTANQIQLEAVQLKAFELNEEITRLQQLIAGEQA